MVSAHDFPQGHKDNVVRRKTYADRDRTFDPVHAEPLEKGHHTLFSVNKNTKK